MPEQWRCYLEENVRHFRCQPEALRERLQEKVRIFVGERNWVECGGLTIDDEVRVTIAGQACLLLLGYEDDFCFDRLRSVLVYPGTFVRPPTRMLSDAVMVGSAETPILGEAWRRGPLVLSWAHALAGGHDADHGRNVVLHEFAHHIDELDGAMDGTPPLGSRKEYCRWARVTGREFRRLADAARRGRATLLDYYGAENEVEFFAVATECFFMRPRRMREQHRQLYEVLQQFYRLDTAAWYEPSKQPESARKVAEEAGNEEADYQQGVARTLRSWRLPPGGSDEAFAEGIIHLQHRQYRRALECFGEALRRDPADAEAYWQRGLVQMETGELPSAIDDFSEAIRLAPEVGEYYLDRSRAYKRLGNTSQARADREEALRRDPDARWWPRG